MYPEMDLSGISSMDAPSMLQVIDSPPAGVVEAFLAPTEEEEDVVGA